MPLLNTRLMKNPLNWVTVGLMLVIAGWFGHYVLALFDQDPASAKLVTPSLSSEQLTRAQQGSYVT